MISSVQACTVIQRQALALANGDVLLQGHIAVHSAVFAVKDDAAGTIATCFVLNPSRRITRNSTGTAVGSHGGVAADGQVGCAGAGSTGAKYEANS